MTATKITVTSVTKDSPGAGQVTIVGTYTAATSYTQPQQQVTVGNFPSGNANWSRALRLTNEAAFVMRNGSTSVSLDATGLAQIGYTLESSLTYAPKVNTQPAAAAGVFAKATLTSNATIPTDGDTVTIGSKTYTFKTTLTPTEGQVLINGTAAAALVNLKAAINHTGVPDTDYKCAAAHTQVSAGTITATTLLLTSLTIGTAANAYASTSTASPRLTFGGATFASGTAAPTFNVTDSSSEIAATYLWEYSANGSTGWTTASGTVNGCTYTNGTTTTLTCTPTTTGQTGYYHRCTLTNSLGSTVTSSAVLTIT